MSEATGPLSPGAMPPTPGAAPGQPAHDPLEALRDIHLPPAVEAWPPAPGWWFMGLCALLALAALIVWAIRRWRAGRYRRLAVAELRVLRNAWERDGNDARLLEELARLLKRVALSAWPRSGVAALTGERWVRFLDDTLHTHEFSMGSGQVLIHGPYQPHAAVEPELLDLAERWIRRHRLEPLDETMPARRTAHA